MTQASKSNLAKRLILETLKTLETQENDPLGGRTPNYSRLFELVKKDIGSRSTFEKYLTELERVHAVERLPDPQDSRAKIIRTIPKTARGELIILDGLEKIQKIILLPISTDSPDRQTRYNLAREDQRQMGVVFELVRVAHSIFIKWDEASLRKRHPDCKDPLDVFLRVHRKGQFSGAIEPLEAEEVEELRRLASRRRAEK